MDNISLEELAAITGGRLLAASGVPQFVNRISIDSRRMPQGAAFFPLKGSQVDGHQFIGDALANGAVGAVIGKEWLDRHPGTDPVRLIAVDDPLEALQRLAAWWRGRLLGRVVAITGSNGKTVVKDALVKVLSPQYLCSGSPDSFNSQIGVPLSVVRIPREVEYAVLEAGVSSPGEMSRIENILRPGYGILTNIGFAHMASFGNRQVITEEKTKLFRNIPADGWVMLPAAEPLLDPLAASLNCRVYRFGQPSEELAHIEHTEAVSDGMRLTVRFPSGSTAVLFAGTPSLEIVSDIGIAIAAACLLGVSADNIAATLSDYTPGNTRMEIWKSPIGFTLINDSCSSDPLSVRAALKSLAFMKQDKGRKIFVFGGMRELGSREMEEHAEVGLLAAQSEVDTLVLVGDHGTSATEKAFKAAAPGGRVVRCASPEHVKDRLVPGPQFGDTVLVKGPRNTGIARVAREIVEAMAPNRFIVDVEAVKENITRFQRMAGPGTRILAMVKALAYGTDSARLSLELQRIGVEAFGVASADEGGGLRRAGVDRTILVMTWTPEEAEKVVRHYLTPVIYSFENVAPLAAAARDSGRTVDVHIEVDTGLGRLGVMPDEVPGLASQIAGAGSLRLAGLMTHFASADDPAKDDFTNSQIQRFKDTAMALEGMGFSGLILHAGATAGAARFPEARFDMIRIGLGMYGIYPSSAVARNADLELAVSLVSRIVEIRVFEKDAHIGYGGTFSVPRDGFRVGVVPIGYHDGIPLALSNAGNVLVNGKMAPIIGRISMDSMMVDLSNAPGAGPKTDVLIYGRYGGYVLRPEDVADACHTIPYELLVRLGPRVQRIFIRE
ncbi:MAG TPA: alanine racemase [Blastocatellia bacterium]|nr:alanine racemase [Blastocatellia bacterium]